ncbi:MAG TPA: hypothetical protein VL132_13500 [Planctomycetaceae bacterium]|nr:hypothetical protein [Planctomycetaceae bacterium]
MSNPAMTPSVTEKEWTQAAGKARDAAASAGEVASHAASAVGAMASQAVGDVGRRADNLTARAGVGIQELGDELGRNTPHTGLLGSASQAVARTVRESGEYVESAKLSGMTDDVAHVIRRNPIPAVLISLGVGWFVGRSLRK